MAVQKTLKTKTQRLLLGSGLVLMRISPESILRQYFTGKFHNLETINYMDL